MYFMSSDHKIHEMLEEMIYSDFNGSFLCADFYITPGATASPERVRRKRD